MNVEKLKRLQTQVRIGGKGTPRRKKKVMHQSASTDDKRLQSTLKKLSVSTIPGIEEVNIIKDDLTIIHFNNPKAQASLSANTFAVTGHAESKKIVEMLPEILPQLSQETVVQLRAFASQMSNQKKSALNLGDNSAYSSSSGATEDEDVPMLVGDFDDISKTEAATEPSATKQPEALNIPETFAGKPKDSLKDTSSTDMETKELKKSIDCIQENASKQPQNEKKKFPQIYQKQVVVDVSEAPTKSQKNEKLNISNQKGKQSKKEKKDTNVEVNKTKRWAATELISKAMPPSSPVDLIPIATTQYDEGKQKPYQNKTVSEKADNNENENNAKKAENNTKIGKQGDTGTDIGKASKVQGKVSIIDNPLLEGAEPKTEKETSSPIKPVATSPSPNVKQTEPSTLEVATNKEATPIATEKININVTPNAQENMKPNIPPSPPEKINSTVLQDTQEKIYNKRSPAIPEKASPSPLDTSEKTHLKSSPTVLETATPTGLAATREKMSHTISLVSRENPITPAPPVKADTKAPATETSNQIVLPIPDPIIISKSDDIIKTPLASSPTQVEIPSVEIPNKIILQTENKPKENEPARKPYVKVPSQSQAIGTKASSPSKQEPQKISPQRQPQASPKQNVKKSEGSTKRTNAKPPGAKVPTLNAKVNNTQQQQPQSQVSPKMAPNIPSTAPTAQRQSNPTTKPVQKSSTLKTASQPQTKQTVSSKPTPAMKLKAKDTSNLKPSTLCKQASTTATQNPDNLAATPATDKGILQPIGN